MILFISVNDKKNSNEDTIKTKVDLIEKIRGREEFFEVKRCVDKYTYLFQDIKEIKDGESYSEEEKNEELNYISEEMYDILDENYINYSKITKDSIMKKMYEEQYEKKYIITEIIGQEIGNDQKQYIVSGFIINISTNERENFTIAIRKDSNNKTFSVYPQEYVEYKKWNELKVGDSFTSETKKITNKNENNCVENREVTDEEVLKYYYAKYKYLLIYDNIEAAFEILDEEYRTKRFENNVDEFKKYVELEYNKILDSDLKEYYISDSEETYDETTSYTQYVCKDQYGKYYMINETGTNNYTMYLDSYTIETESFTSNYEDSTEEEKVGLNVGKIIEAINNKDYKYVYNKLSDEYKNKFFNTQEELINYIQENFYEQSYIEEGSCEKTNDTFVCKIKLFNSQDEESTGKEKTIIMKLLEETNFVMSFSL